jgi:hypothetical protein
MEVFMRSIRIPGIQASVHSKQQETKIDEAVVRISLQAEEIQIRFKANVPITKFGILAETIRMLAEQETISSMAQLRFIVTTEFVPFASCRH